MSCVPYNLCATAEKEWRSVYERDGNPPSIDNTTASERTSFCSNAKRLQNCAWTGLDTYGNNLGASNVCDANMNAIAGDAGCDSAVQYFLSNTLDNVQPSDTTLAQRIQYCDAYTMVKHCGVVNNRLFSGSTAFDKVQKLCDADGTAIGSDQDASCEANWQWINANDSGETQFVDTTTSEYRTAFCAKHYDLQKNCGAGYAKMLASSTVEATSMTKFEALCETDGAPKFAPANFDCDASKAKLVQWYNENVPAPGYTCLTEKNAADGLNDAGQTCIPCTTQKAFCKAYKDYTANACAPSETLGDFNASVICNTETGELKTGSVVNNVVC